MEEQLFVRIRGRVQGPYEVEKLRTLVRRGQLSRMHEVSSDGSVWKQAAEYPDLFVSPTINDVGSHTQPSDHSTPDNDIPDVDRPSTTSSSRWHYAQSGIQVGPVSFEELKSLIASGNVASSDLVWTDGMPNWIPANSVTGLLPRSRVVDGSNILKGDILRTVSEGRPWINFIALVTCFVGSLMLVFGGCAIVFGARWNQQGTIASGGFLMLYGIVTLWGGQLLLRYSSDLNRVLQNSTISRLDKALRSLQRFWIFLSVVMIVLLVNVIGLAIWAFSIGISLSG